MKPLLGRLWRRSSSPPHTGDAAAIAQLRRAALERDPVERFAALASLEMLLGVRRRRKKSIHADALYVSAAELYLKQIDWQLRGDRDAEARVVWHGVKSDLASRLAEIPDSAELRAEVERVRAAIASYP